MYNINPQNASNFVAGVDLAFMIILGVSIFFLVAITIVMLIFIKKGKQRQIFLSTLVLIHVYPGPVKPVETVPRSSKWVI